MSWDATPRPAEAAEARLINAILEGRFPIGSNLPSERELAAQLAITRPTLREVLQRLARDGWVEIHHGRPTLVQDYWREGSLGVLGAIARNRDHLPPEFVPNLLRVRTLLAPSYARQAVDNQPELVVHQLQELLQLEDTPQAFATGDWRLHHTLTWASGNPVFTLILNGFRDLSLSMGPVYFNSPQTRRHSLAFYTALLEAATAGDQQGAELLTRRVMQESLQLWQAAVELARGELP